MIRLAQEPGFRRRLEQIKATGGCAHPVHLAGHTINDAATAPGSDQAVAVYIAEQRSKSVGDAGGTDRPVTSAEEIALLPVSAHIAP
ncbi:hypothetical protein [Streptomyces sp. NPDC056255]|uniref:hypothetical protein n=1 Tax=Streptomyces sp. NPDC056255 TaxID=3345764 RepID=UPI0035D8D25B